MAIYQSATLPPVSTQLGATSLNVDSLARLQVGDRRALYLSICLSIHPSIHLLSLSSLY